MHWTIQEVTQATGISSRTLRHYDQIGLLPATATAAGGMRLYDQDSLVRLQRILLLRETGMGLTAIQAVVDGAADNITALRDHRDALVRERHRVDAQLASIDATITALKERETIMPQTMFDGFDHNKYDAEVRERWGDDPADRSQNWWNGLTVDEKQDFRKQLDDLNDAWDAVITSGEGPDSEAAQGVAALHVAWMGAGMQGTQLSAEMLKGISDMYVADERFAANYNRASSDGPQFVRDALHAWADANLTQ